MTVSRFIRLVAVAACLSSLIVHGQVLSAAQAKDHVGETATVCGTIASETAATGSRGTHNVHQSRSAVPSSVIYGIDLGF